MSTPTDREIVLSRDFDAPRRPVFDALTRPELLRRWFGARGWHLVHCEIDLRVGGSWRFVSEGPTGERMAHGGIYQVVKSPDQLVYTERYDEQSYPGDTAISHRLAEHHGVTTLTTIIRYAIQAGRDRVLRYPMVRGVTESYRRFDETLGQPPGDQTTDVPRGSATMNWTLEVVVVPVSDVDRAKAFYADQLGFHVDHDVRGHDDARIVQLTPPGSGCSIVIGHGVGAGMAAGSLRGLQLVVPDIEQARAQLVERGVEVSEIQVLGENPAPVPEPLDNVGFVFFTDPDGNAWAVQQISSR